MPLGLLVFLCFFRCGFAQDFEFLGVDNEFRAGTAVAAEVAFDLRSARQLNHAIFREQRFDFLGEWLPHLASHPMGVFLAVWGGDDHVDFHIQERSLSGNGDEFVLGNFPNQVDIDFHDVVFSFLKYLRFNFQTDLVGGGLALYIVSLSIPPTPERGKIAK